MSSEIFAQQFSLVLIALIEAHKGWFDAIVVPNSKRSPISENISPSEFRTQIGFGIGPIADECGEFES